MAKTSAETADAEDPDEAVALLAVATLAGDVRDFILDRLKNDHSPLPWNLRGEAEQNRYIEQSDTAAKRLVAQVAGLVATRGQPAIGGRVKKAAMRDVISVEIHVGLTHPLRHELLDAIGSEIMVVLPRTEELTTGDRGRPKATKDQRQLFDDQNPDAELA